jgi:peptidoglycan/LPS O-acetylase OafA/YrhL
MWVAGEAKPTETHASATFRMSQTDFPRQAPSLSELISPQAVKTLDRAVDATPVMVYPWRNWAGDFMTGRPRELAPLTSLRFFAALMIVVFHARDFFPWPWLKQTPLFLPTGVSFFFVFSGFILTHVYRSKRISYLQFIWLRIARLWPVHAAMFLFVVALLPTRELFDTPTTGIVSLLLLQSYVPLMGYYLSWDGAAWSISTEFFFYLLFPFLLVAVDRTWHWKLGAALTLSLAIGLLTARLNLPPSAGPLDLAGVSFVIPFPPMRLAEFCLGMAACVVWSRWVQPMKAGALVWTILECAAVALTVAWLFNVQEVVSRITVYPLALWIFVAGGAPLFAVLIVALADGRGIVGRILSRREFVYLGAISFPLYLLHYPVMRLMQLRNVGETLVFGDIFFGSIVLHEVIEKPARIFLIGVRWPLFAQRENRFQATISD